jgi:hypothetical protein
MHYILCSDNRITYTLIINDYSCNIHEYLDVMKVLHEEDCGVKVNSITRRMARSSSV